MSDEIKVETPEEISLAFYPAGLGSRFIAYLIDSIILLVTAVLLIFAILFGGIAPEARFWILAVGIGYLTMGQFFYFILFEWIWEGQTPGKRLMRIKVMRDGAFPLTGAACVIRNIFRILDGFPLFWIVVLLNRSHKRLGDYVAGTIVIALKQAKTISLFPGEVYSRLEPKTFLFTLNDFKKLNRKDFKTLETFFERSQEMDPQIWPRLRLNFFELFQKKLGKEAFPDQAQAFLKELYLFLREEWQKKYL